MECDKCGRRFSTKQWLQYHQDHNVCDKAYMCKPCGRTFTRSANLRKHCTSSIHRTLLAKSSAGESAPKIKVVCIKKREITDAIVPYDPAQLLKLLPESLLSDVIKDIQNKSIPYIIEKILELPQHRNLYITDINRGFLKVYRGDGKWDRVIGKPVIKTLVETIFTHLNDHYDKLSGELSFYQKSMYDAFQKDMDRDTSETYREVKKAVQLILYNAKNK